MLSSRCDKVKIMITHQGKQYARVSEVLKPFYNFSGIDKDVLERKADLGTQVHSAIADDIAGRFPCPGAAGWGYFQSYLKWKERLSPLFVESEKRYFDENRMITGAIDALIKIPDESLPILVDFKTSAQEAAISWPMQAHLYGLLLEGNGIEIARRYLFVKFHKKGFLPVVFEYKFDKNILSKCLNSIDLFWKSGKS